ncbi:S8 family serine peptidase [Cryptosporangium aurantiacum]|uniref:Type VII secretion-associated serine protease mycosin n=1 Tax=Cryptosporangium aurantiacum TaxID=134849 RepID=A0A1M7RMQ1_9ACTN|nr:S8 family serine peptidase [Cryptosporangium aurantiacum]SHN47460.1 type VII secretion-associated serine protease mycosin [Cryptosporangium aurantiacum]
MTEPTPRTRRPGARFTAGVAGLAGLGLVAGVVAAPSTVLAEGAPDPVTTTVPVTPVTTPAAPATTLAGAAGRATAAPVTWSKPGASVTAPPESVVAGVSADERVRIVTVRNVDGKPVVSTRAVTGREAAAAAVADSQEDAGTVSVGVDQVVRIADAEPAPTTAAAAAPTTAAPTTSAAATSTDTLRSGQWALTRLRAEDTWARTTGGSVLVAVVDSGVQANHPDLAGRVVSGVDLVRDTSSTDGSYDPNGHGTHVAGIIGAIANNNQGIAGLAPGATILPVRVLGANGSGYSSAVATGIIESVDRNAAVINMSLGSSTRDSAITSAVQYALSKNVTVIASAGNSRMSGNPVNWPAAETGVIGVAATDSADQDASFSNTGSYVDIAAPGVAIVSTYRGSAYVSMNGTSMAAPYVAATAALAKAVSPGLTPAAMTTLLQNTATDLGTAGRDNAFGYGLVNPYAAVCSLGGCAATPAPTTSPAPTTPAPTTPAPTTSPAPTTRPTTPPKPTAPAKTTFTLTSGSGKKITAGTAVTVTATLTSGSTRTPTPLPNAAIHVCVRTAPATKFTCEAGQTDAGGTARYSASPNTATTVYFTHPGGTGTTASKSATASYPVIATAQLVTQAGGTLAVTVNPAAGQVLTLDRWTGKTWAKVTTKKVSAAGQASFTGLTAGSYRVRVPASGSALGSTSGAVTVA